MFFYPFDVTTPHIIYALLGAFIVLFVMFSLFLREKLYVGEAILAFIFGIIIGPYGVNILDPRLWGHGSTPDEPVNLITLEFTRIVLAIGVFAIGVELPRAYMVKHWKSLFFLLVPCMTWGWFVCAGLVYALIPGLNFLSSLAISACLTPTDPILASAVVGGKWADKHVPAHIRHLLAAESGCNDGAAFPFLFFALYLMTDLPNVGNALRDWFLILWLYDVILGILIGSFLGFSFRHLMKFCQRHDLIDRQSYVAQYLSLAFLTIGITTLLGSDDLLAAFACGTSFAWDGFFNKQTEESVFSSVIDILFNIAAFIFVGAWMPFGDFHKNMNTGMGIQVWRLIVLAILILLLRRLPIMMAMYRWIPDVKTWREAVFSGHFGPMGIGAIFISTLASEFLKDHIDRNPSSSDDDPQIEMVRVMIQPVVAFVVLCSITIHGLSIPGFSLGRRVHTVSRTWSRRDTVGSGRVGAPDWTNLARLVSRAEDIVVNRDLEKGGVPLEKTMTNEETLKSDSIADPTPISTDDHGIKSPLDGEGVVERRFDEVTVVDNHPNGNANTTSRTERSTRASILKNFNIKKSISEMENRTRMGRRPTTADTLVADEDIDGHRSHYSQEASAPPPILPAPRLTRSPSRIHVGTTINLNLADEVYDNDYESAANDINEVPRERENMNQNTRRTMTESSLGSRKNLPSSAILSPIFPSPTRPRTAPASSTMTTISSSAPLASRPGTADSIRHHRLDSIRAPPTRESSPSRLSVRFVEPHGDGDNDGNGGKNVEMLPSSLYRDEKTLVDSSSPVEGESSTSRL